MPIWLFLAGNPIMQLQSGAVGFNNGMGEKLSNSQTVCLAGVTWELLSYSPFPVLISCGPPSSRALELRAPTCGTIETVEVHGRLVV